MHKHLFITGNSSGLGHGLTESFLIREWQVYGISRRGCDLLDPHQHLHDLRFDLADQAATPAALQQLLGGLERLDLVILNAGVLGTIDALPNIPLAEFQRVMEVNVWSNKVILDWLLQSGIDIDQIVLISSGAAVNGHYGWGPYALSKATLNMLTRLYAHEFPATTHLTALAPGLVDTAMQDVLCEEVDAERFTSLQRLKAARGTATMPGPAEAAERIVEALPQLRALPSGGYIDIRKLSPN